jgi:hypothetical protein
VRNCIRYLDRVSINSQKLTSRQSSKVGDARKLNRSLSFGDFGRRARTYQYPSKRPSSSFKQHTLQHRRRGKAVKASVGERRSVVEMFAPGSRKARSLTGIRSDPSPSRVELNSIGDNCDVLSCGSEAATRWYVADPKKLQSNGPRSYRPVRSRIGDRNPRQTLCAQFYKR